jgi:Ni,Fe-hydrogenase III large subunit/Ni,Fe-hydrogenase III component G
MAHRAWLARSTVQSGAPGLRALAVSKDEWRDAARDLAAAGARLLALWVSHAEDMAPVIYATYLLADSALVLRLPITAADAVYPGIEDLFPCATRLQRATADLAGVRSTDPDTRPWLSHAAWPTGFRPLVDVPQPAIGPAAAVEAYPFIRVEGDGVHEIPVGPVHAGIIEPGHFRFSVVGEKILRLEARLGYVHKGIERRFTELPIMEGHRLAARISGDSAAAYSWAYCQALEAMSGAEIPARGLWLRALCLELERVANHLGDLGALGNDAGFSFGLTQFSRLKEQLLRATLAGLGQRYLLDIIVPGGTRVDLAGAGMRQLGQCVLGLAREAKTLRTVYEEHEGVRDRFNGAGTVSPALARQLGLTGLAGRASGQPFDLRVDQPCEPYTELSPRKMGHTNGDVAARVVVRFDELQESCRLIRRILDHLPPGPHYRPVAVPLDTAFAVGIVEAWRGPVLVALESAAGGAIRRCHPHDCSWQNWPVLEHAVIGNIVPDFPLINKSFNLSYSGHDL